MNVGYIHKVILVGALVVFGAGFGLRSAIAQTRGPADDQPGVQVLTRGPVHEAFAETVTFNPQPGIVVPKAPREIIEELPPDQRPDGANVTWIPGYWAWDDERTDFLWVSGIWRDLPPGRQWVPGYWGQAAQGYQWTSGYWADANVSQTEYFPEPPATIEVGPNIPAPSSNQGWVPGCWIWHDGRYAWRPGYWAAGQQDWDWVPAHYTWAPRGYIYSDGYWDHSVGRRGVLFAPVYFEPNVYARPDFHYSPSIVIDVGVFIDQLFLRPQYQHYYFGDYYAASYQNAGYYSSFSDQSRRYGYDPIYAHERWDHRKDNEWEKHAEATFTYRRDHEDARPPRTLVAQRALSARGPTSVQTGLVIATSLGEMAKRKDNPVRLQPVAQVERQTLAQRGRDVQTFRGERQKLETTAPVAAAAKPVRAAEPVRVKLPKPLIVAKPANQLGKQAPPKVHQVPKLDPKIEPATRSAVAAPNSPKPQAKPDERKVTPPKSAPKERSQDESKDQRKDDKKNRKD